MRLFPRLRKARRERDLLADAGFIVLHERDMERSKRKRLEVVIALIVKSMNR